MSAKRQITPHELEVIRRGVDRAWLQWIEKHEPRWCGGEMVRWGHLGHRLLDDERRSKAQIKRGKQIARRTLNGMRIQDKMNWLVYGDILALLPSEEWASREALRTQLAFRVLTGRAATDSPSVKDALDEAWSEHDLGFTRLIAHVAQYGAAVFPSMTKLEWLFLTHWDYPQNGRPELFRLTEEGLWEVCHAIASVKLTVAAIIKARQRLHLPYFKRCKLRVIKLEGGGLSFAPRQRFVHH